MNYGKLILEKLLDEKDKFAETKSSEIHTTGEPHGRSRAEIDRFNILQHNEDEFHFQVKFKDIDKYGIVLDYISISKATPIMDLDIINKKLESDSNKIQTKITYLLEDFKLIELDRMNKRAQLRSYPPYEEEDSKYYYEIVLDEANRVHFQRYQYSSSNKRYEKITCQLTLEIFERLINDLVSTLK